MVDPINSLNGLSRPVGAGKVPVTDNSKTSVGIIPGAPTVQISGDAATLSSLYEATSAFVQKASIKPLTGSNEDDPRSWYLNVEKFNDHIFDQAASSLVGEAHKLGIELNKDDVVKQFREKNRDISSYKFDMQNRDSKIHPDSVFKNLSKSDLDNVTDFYINANSKGLPDIVSDVYAINLGDTNKMRNLGIKFYSGAEYIINDVADPPGGIPEAIADGAKKLYGHFGMTNMLVNTLAAGYTTPNDISGRQQVFQLLLEMLAENPPSTINRSYDGPRYEAPSIMAPPRQA